MTAKRKKVAPGFQPAVVAEFAQQFRRLPKIPDTLVELSRAPGGRRQRARANQNAFQPFAFPQFPKEAMPAKSLEMAQDSSLSAAVNWSSSMVGINTFNTAFAEGMTFQGYTYLALLAQRPEYRVISETIATEMTRKWITIQSKATDDKKPKRNADSDKPENGEPEPEGAEDKSPEALEKEKALAAEAEERDGEAGDDTDDQDGDGDVDGDDKAEKIKKIEAEFERLDVRGNFRKTAENDGFFGRAHLFLDFGSAGGDKTADDELKTPIGDGSIGDKTAKAKCSPSKPLVRLQPVEALWCYPTGYNSTNPLAADWYRPQNWFAMGKEVHASRLLLFVGREVPDQLKPSYAFGGLSMSQMAQPYVDNWLRTRQSVADIVHAFSVMVLACDMATMMGIGADEVMKRVQLFNNTRDNKGVFQINKDTEEFSNVAAPITGLDTLQAQTQEHMSSVSRIPLVKLLGIQPAGLNASSEGEIRTFYDTIEAYQEKFYRPNLTIIFRFVQLSLFGSVDPDLTFKFNPLWSLDAKGEAEVRKLDAETDVILIGEGVIDPAESRKRVATDPNTPYKALDVDDLPEPPEDDMLLEAGAGAPGASPGGKKGPGAAVVKTPKVKQPGAGSAAPKKG